MHASDMKALIIRIISVLFLFSFCSICLWHYTTQRIAAADERLRVNQNPTDSKNAAAIEPQEVKQNAVNKMAKVKIIKKKRAKNKNAGAGNPLKVNQDPAGSIQEVPSVQFIVEKKPTKGNDSVVVDPLKVHQSPAESEDAAAIDPQKVNQKPAANAHLNNPKENKPNVKDDVVLDPHEFMQNLNNFKNEIPNDREDAQKHPEAIERENKAIDGLLEKYNSKWKKHEKAAYMYRSYLSRTCNAISEAIATQDNVPVGTMFTYDGDNKRKMEVTPNLFKLFPKENPFKNAPWDTCAVVGNGGILANSSCGNEIDSATYVIRCNLPPLNNGYDKDTGNKTNLVTANPSILVNNYQALNEYRRAFVEDMKMYRNAHILLPAFSFPRNTGVSLRVRYTLEDYNPEGPQAIFYNPAYMNSIIEFWRDQGMRSLRLSTGIMMVTLAMELCHNVHLYGFWPFGLHPHTRQPLTNHYYDDQPVNKRVHEMPAEFESLLNLHNKGVIQLHLGECRK